MYGEKQVMEQDWSRDEVNARIMAQYHDVLGKVVLVFDVGGHVDEDSEFVECEPPLVARVVETRRDRLLRWMDDKSCDPCFDLEILEPHPDLPDGLTSPWAYGRGYTDGRDNGCSFVVANEDMQQRYLPYEQAEVDTGWVDLAISCTP